MVPLVRDAAAAANVEAARARFGATTILDWLPRGGAELVGSDVIAELPVWVLLVPQSMAHTSVVGVPV